MMDDFFADDWIPDPDEAEASACVIESLYRVRPIADVAARFRCHGVTRYLVSPEFCPERIVTCVWQASGVLIDYVQGRTCLYDPTVPFNWRRVQRCHVWLPTFFLPRLLRGWARVRQAVEEAPSCATPSFGGSCRQHRLWDGRQEVLREWFNPDEVKHPRQCAILRA